MISLSPTIFIFTLGLGLFSLGVFFWACVKGYFDAPDEQMMQIFDPYELRYERPWETVAQKSEREALYGRPLPAPLCEWGNGRTREMEGGTRDDQ